MSKSKPFTIRLSEEVGGWLERENRRTRLPKSALLKVLAEESIRTRRFPGIAAHYGRRTERLDGWLTHVSFALGREAGSRLLKDLGVVVSGDTLLNRIRSMRLPSRETPRILSVDDFAFRRGTRYGTVLVDLERHTLVDVLPDGSADTFARWLQEHSGVETLQASTHEPER